MARIFGVVSPRATQLLRPMAAAAEKGYPEWGGSVRHVAAGTRASFGAFDRRPDRHVAADDEIIVVLDGAIYNRKDFDPTPTDAELVANLYRRHGFEGLLAHLNGDFSIALYDNSTDSAWLGRDRLGVKPLYYTHSRGELAFASRPASLLALPDADASINVRFAAVFASSHYRYFDNVPQESPYEHIAQLPAGHLLCVRGGQLRVSCYWRLTEQPNFTESEAELAQRYRELLLDSVRLRYAASERAAFTLSGGMDSSSVLGCAREITDSSQVAFSTVYSDKTFDETDEIRPMLGHAVAKWCPVLVDKPNVFDLVRRMVAVNDEPVATATWLSHFLLCQQVTDGGFDALFGGLGGDELNAGEYEYFFFFFADLMQRGDPRLATEIQNWAAHHDHPIYRKSAAVAATTVERCTDRAVAGRCRPDLSRMQRYYPALRKDFFEIDRFQPVMEAPFSSYLKTRSYQDLTRETAPCCLRAEDRHTQAFGIENHVPFFDHRLVEFMFRVPGTLKIREGVTKILLRSAVRGILPEETRTRIKKTGWNAPAHLWFSGDGKDAVQDLVRSRSFRERGIYDVEQVSRIVDEHHEIVSSGAVRENHMMFLWQLVNLELWLQSLTDGRRVLRTSP